MGRSEIIRSLFDCGGLGLEIGPSHNPLMPKSAGFNVEILDYLDADGLRKKYTYAGQDVSRIEEVDYISDGRPMTEVIGDRNRYDWIIASHVIEHVPDLVAFLADCEALLKPRGSLVLAVPDKRCCFDILRPISTVGQVLQAHIDRRIRPAPGTIFDDLAYARKRNGQIGWALNDKSRLDPVRSIEEARQVFEHASKTTDYLDVHCWVFVPSSFRLILNTLVVLELTRLREQCFRDLDSEFFVALSTKPSPINTDLGQLALAAQLEERLCIPEPEA
jgi:SAM-dependent methyltransferase